MSTATHKVQLLVFIEKLHTLRRQLLDEGLDLSNSAGAPTSLSKAILLEAYNCALKDCEGAESNLVKNLQPQQGLYRKRPAAARSLYNPRRSYSILCDAQGVFKLVIEVKSKYFDNKKRSINWPAGSFKKCKVCYVISEYPFFPYASLLIKYDQSIHNINFINDSISTDMQEVKINNLLAADAPEFFNKIDSYIEHRKKNIVVHMFAKNEEFCLQDLLDNRRLDACADANGLNINRELINFNGVLVEKCKLDIIWQLCQAVAKIHSNGYAHRDLKPANILCEYDPPQKRLHIKIIDFGLANKLKETDVFVCGSWPQMPPELFYLQYLEAKSESKNSQLALQQLINTRHYVGQAIGLDRAISNIRNKRDLYKPEPGKYSAAHDVWSVGTIISEILGNSMIMQFTKMFLASDPKARKSASEAVILLSGMQVMQEFINMPLMVALPISRPVQRANELVESLLNLYQAADNEETIQKIYKCLNDLSIKLNASNRYLIPQYTSIIEKIFKIQAEINISQKKKYQQISRLKLEAFDEPLRHKSYLPMFSGCFTLINSCVNNGAYVRLPKNSRLDGKEWINRIELKIAQDTVACVAEVALAKTISFQADENHTKKFHDLLNNCDDYYNAIKHEEQNPFVKRFGA